MTDQVKITAHVDGVAVVVAKGRTPATTLSKFMYRYYEKFPDQEGKNQWDS